MEFRPETFRFDRSINYLLLLFLNTPSSDKWISVGAKEDGFYSSFVFVGNDHFIVLDGVVGKWGGYFMEFFLWKGQGEGFERRLGIWRF